MALARALGIFGAVLAAALQLGLAGGEAAAPAALERSDAADPDAHVAQTFKNASRWQELLHHLSASVPVASAYGFKYVATTTRYGTNAHTACEMNTNTLVA